jgi:hypothetical protein
VGEALAWTVLPDLSQCQRIIRFQLDPSPEFPAFPIQDILQPRCIISKRAIQLEAPDRHRCHTQIYKDIHRIYPFHKPGKSQTTIELIVDRHLVRHFG